MNNLLLMSSSSFYKLEILPNPKPSQWFSYIHMCSLQLDIADDLHLENVDDLVLVDLVNWSRLFHT